MSTWGTGLFSSDTAMDFVDELASVPASERGAMVERVLDAVVRDPDTLMRDVMPEEALAAAALVAAALPGGDDMMSSSGEETAGIAPIRYGDAARLAVIADEAVGIVAAPDSWWMTSWTSESDRAEATAQITDLRQHLRHARR